MDKGLILLKESELRLIIDNAFQSGAQSHSNWIGQRDTCWSHVDDDKRDYVSDIVNETILK